MNSPIIKNNLNVYVVQFISIILCLIFNIIVFN